MLALRARSGAWLAASRFMRVAEFVRLGGARGFHAGRLLARIVPPVAALAERAEQIAQRAVAEKIQRLVGDLEGGRLAAPQARSCRGPDAARARRRDRAAR